MSTDAGWPVTRSADNASGVRSADRAWYRVIVDMHTIRTLSGKRFWFDVYARNPTDAVEGVVRGNRPIHHDGVAFETWRIVSARKIYDAKTRAAPAESGEHVRTHKVTWQY